MNAFGKYRVLVLMTSLMAGCTGFPTAPHGVRATPAVRGELRDIRATRKQLPGTTMADVLRAVGKPDRQTGNSEWEWWTYEEAFFDPITKRTLRTVTFVFRDGRVVEILF